MNMAESHFKESFKNDGTNSSPILNPQNMGEKAYLLTKEQYAVYVWLKAQGLNTDDHTLNYWSKTYDEKRIKTVVNFAHRRISMGQNIRNVGGWIHKLLKTGLPVVNEKSEANRKFAEWFIECKKWKDLMIYEKYVKDLITGDDLPLTLIESDFRIGLDALFQKSSMYKDVKFTE